MQLGKSAHTVAKTQCRQKINKCFKNNDCKLDIDFDCKTKIWLFAEIAIDAIFNGSELSQISTKPAYEYFYGTEVNNMNFIDHFRILYKNCTIDEFLSSKITVWRAPKRVTLN